ncbi:MAG: alcohol dehydrogenase catalytic domain-containing protein [Nevskia sp.]|nr:alcohol dehydrogenase catalytic domain-containing protein [Nevskia sp.]
MRSYVVKQFGQEIEPVDAPDLQPSGTEVVIKVTRCGVCHSDIHLQDGFYELGGDKRLTLGPRGGIFPPLVLGHEVLGRLVAKGPDAPIADGELGKQFLIFPWIGCGQCDSCKRGEEQNCNKPAAIGVNKPGGYADQCLVPHPKYLIDFGNLDPAFAATLACSGLTAYGALKKIQCDREHDWLLILGAGGVGLSAVSLAKAIGFKNIAVADIDPAKRALAEGAGAALSVDPRDPAAVAGFQKTTKGVAGAIDFVGASSTADFGIAALRRGGTFVGVGLMGGETVISTVLLVLRNICIRASYVGSLEDLKELVALARSGKVSPLPMELAPMADVKSALARLRQGQVKGRLVLVGE